MRGQAGGGGLRRTIYVTAIEDDLGAVCCVRGHLDDVCVSATGAAATKRPFSTHGGDYEGCDVCEYTCFCISEDR